MGWAFLPPLQRTVGDAALVSRPHDFPKMLPAWRDPSFASHELTHLVSPEAPSGVLDGDGSGSPATRSAAPEMTLLPPARPSVQRSPSVSAPVNRSLTRTSTDALPVLQLAAVDEPSPPVQEASPEPAAPTADPAPTLEELPSGPDPQPAEASAAADEPQQREHPLLGTGAGNASRLSDPPPSSPSSSPATPAVQRSVEPGAKRRFGLGAPLASLPPSSTPVTPVGPPAATPAATPTATPADTTAAIFPAAAAAPEPATTVDIPTRPADVTPNVQRASTTASTTASPSGPLPPGRATTPTPTPPAPEPPIVVARTVSPDQAPGPAASQAPPAMPLAPTGSDPAPSEESSAPPVDQVPDAAPGPAPSPAPEAVQRPADDTTDDTSHDSASDPGYGTAHAGHNASHAGVSEGHEVELTLSRSVDPGIDVPTLGDRTPPTGLGTGDTAADDGVPPLGHDAGLGMTSMPLAPAASAPSESPSESVSEAAAEGAPATWGDTGDVAPNSDLVGHSDSTDSTTSTGSTGSTGPSPSPTSPVTRPLLGIQRSLLPTLSPTSVARTPVRAADTTVARSITPAGAPTRATPSSPAPAAASRSVQRSAGQLPVTGSFGAHYPSHTSADQPAQPAGERGDAVDLPLARSVDNGAATVTGQVTSGDTGRDSGSAPALQATYAPAVPVTVSRALENGATEVPIQTTEATATPAGGAAPGQASAGGSPSSPEEVDALAQKLLAPMMRRIRSEMLLDRERRGLRTDSW